MTDLAERNSRGHWRVLWSLARAQRAWLLVCSGNAAAARARRVSSLRSDLNAVCLRCFARFMVTAGHAERAAAGLISNPRDRNPVDFASALTDQFADRLFKALQGRSVGLDDQTRRLHFDRHTSRTLCRVVKEADQCLVVEAGRPTNGQRDVVRLHPGTGLAARLFRARFPRDCTCTAARLRRTRIWPGANGWPAPSHM